MKPAQITPDSDVCFYSEMEPFKFQTQWNAQASDSVRVLTKMRQCGADWFFSLEALADAIATGRNQVFIGCAPDQSMANKAYINSILNAAGQPLKKHVLRTAPHYVELCNGAHIYFIDAECHCAGLSGNVYASEYAWSDTPDSMIKLAKSIAMHKRHHATYYTTPSENPAAFMAYQSLIGDNSATHITFTADDARQSQSSLFSESWLDVMKRDLTAESWKMLFMCEWPQAQTEKAA